MLYMPASTYATPIVLQEAQPVPAARYVMLQSTPAVIPTIPVLSTALVYPKYTLAMKTIEKDETEKTQVTPPVQHVIHHHTYSKSCPGYCELCCPWIEDSTQQRPRSRSRSPSPVPPSRDQQRYSRRDQYEHTTFNDKHETIDEKIERIRRELTTSSISKRDKSTETIDYYRPAHNSPAPGRVIYKQHYDAPKPRSRSRSRSTSSRRASSLPREPWRSSNQNDYPWRDSHLPAYREATIGRSQTALDQTSTWDETAHHRSHQNTQKSRSYYNDKEYVYRPSSEAEARKWYTQTTGKNADREVHQSLYGAPATYQTSPSTTTYYTRYQNPATSHAFYSDIPSTKTHYLHKVDSTPYHNLYGCNEPCLHVVPKHGSTLDPPYLKVLNAPVTYIH